MKIAVFDQDLTKTLNQFSAACGDGIRRGAPDGRPILRLYPMLRGLDWLKNTD